MQKNLSVVMLLALLVAVSVPTGLAFAQEEPTGDQQEITIGLQFGEAIAKAGGTGAIAGIVLSLVRTVGKRIENAKETIDPKKLGLNILIGAVTGAVLTYIGLPIDATIAGNFLALYVVNQFRPLISKWITGQKQTE